MRKTLAWMLLLIASLAVDPEPVQAAEGHENNCSVLNVNYGTNVMTVICATGTINMASLRGTETKIPP